MTSTTIHGSTRERPEQFPPIVRWLDVRRLHLVIALCACSPPTTPDEQRVSIDRIVVLAPEDATAAAPPDAPSSAENVAVSPRAPTALWSGQHGTAIVRVEVADDASAAVTIDAIDRARLWPALDGSHEPLVLPLSMPADIALHHDESGFAIAAVDIVGGLEIIAVDDEDRLVAKRTLDRVVPFESVVSTQRGFIATRTDHRIEWIDHAGNERDITWPPYGLRIARVLAAAGRVFVLFDVGWGSVRGGWLELGTRDLHWGDHLLDLELDPQCTFISPDGARLVSQQTRDGRRHPVLVDLSTGAARYFEDSSSLVEPAGRPLGFADAETVVFSGRDGSGLVWYRIDGKQVSKSDDARRFEFLADSTMIAAGKAVSFIYRHLAIATLDATTFVGYRKRSIESLRASAAGAVATTGESVLLDEQLRAAQRLPADSVPVTRDLALVRLGVAAGSGMRVALYDLAARRELQAWPFTRRETRVRFDRVTGVLAIDQIVKLAVLRFDPMTRRFGEPIVAATPVLTDSVIVDPALAGGDILITSSGSELRRWSLGDLATGSVPDATLITGTLETIDRAGRVYARVDDAIVVTTRDREYRVASLVNWHVRPSPNGTQIAAFAFDRVMMTDARGRELWSIALPGVDDLAWTTDGLVVKQAGDLARLALHDGTIELAHCGWGFGAFPDRPEPEAFDEAVSTSCDR